MGNFRSKAEERIKAAEELLRMSLYGDSIGRSYYAIFTSARALLALLGLDSSKHSGVISFFNRYWVKSGIMPKEYSTIIADAKRDRETSDYGDFVEFTCEDAEA
ncbi:HEPN domain-containing protein, partial [bacterium]|nr:HEPN domain-containing protein [bacterium]